MYFNFCAYVHTIQGAYYCPLPNARGTLADGCIVFHCVDEAVHPMIRRFREHLDDSMMNEFLWDYRGRDDGRDCRVVPRIALSSSCDVGWKEHLRKEL